MWTQALLADQGLEGGAGRLVGSHFFVQTTKAVVILVRVAHVFRALASLEVKKINVSASCTSFIHVDIA